MAKAIISITEFPTPFMDSFENSCFRALGTIINMKDFPKLNPTDNIVMVYWKVIEGKDNSAHEIEKCDWYQPTSVKHSKINLMKNGFSLKGMFQTDFKAKIVVGNLYRIINPTTIRSGGACPMSGRIKKEDTWLCVKESSSGEYYLFILVHDYLNCIQPYPGIRAGFHDIGDAEEVPISIPPEALKQLLKGKTFYKNKPEQSHE